VSGGERQELATNDGKREPTTCACCRGILEEGEAETCHECGGVCCRGCCSFGECKDCEDPDEEIADDDETDEPGRYCDCCGEKILDDEDTEVCSVCDDEVCGGCIMSGKCNTCLLNDDDLWGDDEDDDLEDDDLEDDGDLDDTDEDFDDDDY
jgi:hypothetical protein